MKKTISLVFDNFEKEVSKALLSSAELARQDAIRTNTGIVVSINNKIVTIPAEQLRTKHYRVK